MKFILSIVSVPLILAGFVVSAPLVPRDTVSEYFQSINALYPTLEELSKSFESLVPTSAALTGIWDTDDDIVAFSAMYSPLLSSLKSTVDEVLALTVSMDDLDRDSLALLRKNSASITEFTDLSEKVGRKILDTINTVGKIRTNVIGHGFKMHRWGYDSELVSREINIQVMAVNCRIFGMH